MWSADSASVIVVSAEKGSSNLKRVNVATSAIEPVTEGLHDVGAYSAANNGRIAATISTQTNIGDIAVIDARATRGAQPTNLVTHVNAALFSGIQQSDPEEINYKSFDGKNIQGWILKPPDFDASKKYP